MKAKSQKLLMQNTVFAWIALGTGLLLLIPLVLTLLNIANGGVEGQGWFWRPGDFVVMGTLMFVTASLFVLVARKVRHTQRRIIIGLAFLIAFLWLWAELAVGVFTHWGS